MALSSSAPDQSVITGILVSVLIADESMQTELYRAPDSSGSPGTFALLSTLDPGKDQFFDLLPLDGATYWYKCRHVLTGVTASGYTSPVSALSRIWSSMPQVALAKQVYPLDRTIGFTDRAYALAAQDTTGKTTPGHIYVPAANTIIVGTAAVPSSITKTIRIPFTEVVPESQLLSWFYTTNGYLDPGGTTSFNFEGSLVMPPGVTLVAARAKLYRNSVSENAQCFLVRLDSSPAVTTIATLTATGTGWVLPAASISEVVGTNSYFITVTLHSSVTATDARFGWFEVDYTMPSYDKGY